MKCPVCKENDFTPFFTRNDDILFNRCNNCRLILTDSRKGVAYEKDYFDKNQDTKMGYREYSRTPIYEFYWQLALVKLLGGKIGDRVLDVGCATGKFIEMALSEGFDVSGIEISNYAFSFCQEKGFKVRLEDIETIKKFNQRYNFICAWDLIEHLKDPVVFFDKAIHAISDNGVIIFSTPNAAGKRDTWSGFTISQEHLIYFSDETLRYLVAHNFPEWSLELIRYRYQGLDTLIGILVKNPQILQERSEILKALKNGKMVGRADQDYLLASVYVNFNQRAAAKRFITKYNQSNSLIQLSMDFKSKNFYRRLPVIRNQSRYWLHDAYSWQYLNYLSDLQLRQLEKDKEILINTLKTEKETHASEKYKFETIIQAIYSSRTWQLLGCYKKAKEFYRRYIRLFVINKKLLIRDRKIPLLNKLVSLFALRNLIYFYKSNEHSYDLVIFPIVSWDHKKQRMHHLARQFARNGHRVFYIENSFVKAKTRNLSRDEVSSLVEYSKTEENIFLVRLVSFNEYFIYQDIIEDEVDKTYLQWSVESVLDRAKVKTHIYKIDAPFWGQLTDRLTGSVIYDCMDEHSGFWTHTKVMSEVEEKLAKDADFVIATARRLYRKMQKFNENVVLVPNACDFNHFNCVNTNVPTELRRIKRPIIGYFGAISDWLDYDLVEYIARKKPLWQIVFVGNTDSRARIKHLLRLNNFNYFGEKKYEDLPAWVHNFDVCIIPFKITPLTMATNPVKMYEIFAAGKPLVSTKLPEVEKVNKFAYVAGNRQEFVNKITQVLGREAKSKIEERIKYARTQTWERRYETITRAIEKYVYPNVSVIILSFNTLSYTKSCLESVLKYSDWPNLEIIVIDNGSSDGSVLYLEKAEHIYPEVKVFYQKKNVGFAAGNNIGLKQARGQYIILLNSDTIVTKGWIKGLVDKLRNNKVGLVGPVTNSIGNEAKVEVAYNKISGLQEFAEKISKINSGGYFEINTLAFFCVAGRRSVWKKIGFLDERFVMGTFEDEDYCLRVKQAGYKLICAEDVFIHHYHGKTREKIPDMNVIFEKNKKKFEEKWQLNWLPHKYRHKKEIHD